MTTPAAAVYGFLSKFGIPAYASSSVPDDAEFPYITYDYVEGSFWEDEMPLVVNVWYRGDGEAEPNAKAHEIVREVTPGGKVLQCEGGGLWIKRGSPLIQSIVDSDDDKVKRRYINLTIESFLGD